jgi:hypothetical protein
MAIHDYEESGLFRRIPSSPLNVAPRLQPMPLGNLVGCGSIPSRGEHPLAA